MQTSSKNSKRCSTASLALLIAAALLRAAPVEANAPTAPDLAPDRISRELRKGLASHRAVSFAKLLRSWETRFGTRAVTPLVAIAGDASLEDTDRYVAVMGAAKLGGKAIAPSLLPLLGDPSWMIRSATLRALSALNHPETGKQVLPLLKDKALLVRSEAVETVARLRPEGSVDALLGALEYSENYHGGKAQMVPQKALSALVALGAREAAPRLAPLLSHERDPELQKRTVEALESLTGKRFRKTASLADQVKAWKSELGS